LTDEAVLASVDTLLGMLRDARMPATWASRRPASSDAVTEVLKEPIGHEIALAGDTERAGGTRHLRELARQVEQAQRAAYRITTLLMQETPSPEELQALCRLGISALATHVRPSHAGLARRLFSSLRRLLSDTQEEPPQPCLVRYGLWEVPAAIDLSASGFASRGLMHRALESAAACGDVLHLLAPMPQLRQGRAGGFKRIEAVLQAAFDLRSQRQLAVQTVGSVVGGLRMQRHGKPAQSILREAA
jgi:hypothetical protein